MKCIDFDRRFSEYTAKWVAENQSRFATYDEMEEHFPEAYLLWQNTPMDWLGGKTPALYFAQYDDAKLLVNWMCDYFKQKCPVPDMLLDRIAELDSGAELARILQSPNKPREAKLAAMGLIKQMQSPVANDLYIAWIAASQKDDELADMAVDSLMGDAAAALEGLLGAFDAATPDGQARMLDVLSCVRGDERVFSLLLDRFERGAGRALYAAYLLKQNDERALPGLLRAIEDPSIGYIDYIEIRNAIEGLGGEVKTTRDFTGDKDFEALRQTL